MRVILDGLRQDLDRTGDNGEHVVEVMRNATRQLAHRLHLLCLNQLLLGRTLLGDIPDKRIDDVAFAATKLGQRHLGENLAAVATQQRRLKSPALCSTADVVQEFADPVIIRVAL